MNLTIKIVSRICLFSWLLGACVTPRMPTGGDKDQTGPRLDSLRYSTPNLSTHFKEKEVILTFDEWIKLSNANTEIIISPPLQNKPKIKVKHKSVVLVFDEILKDSTTYTINYGKAIRDITESNYAKDMTFVFSTGEVIDSLELSGKIVDAKNNQAKKDVLVMLYDNLADSTPIKERPYYFARTDEQGKFKIRHIKSDTFRIFALEDVNKNYLYDLANESIAFFDSSFTVDDSVQPYIQMPMFKETETTQILPVQIEHFACVRIGFNQHIDTVYYDWIGEEDGVVYAEMGQDSMRIYFANLKGDSEVQLVLWDSTGMNDTLDLDFGSSVEGIKALTNLQVVREETRVANTTANQGDSNQISKDFVEQHPLKPLIIKWNRPFRQIDTSKIQILETANQTIIVPSFKLNPEGQTRLKMHYAWKPKLDYEFVAFPNAVTDIYGLSNRDTIRQKVKVNSLEDYGSILVHIENTDSTAVYIAQLMPAGRENQVLETKVLRGKSSYELSYLNYMSQDYMVRLITDENKNGKWDTGAYLSRRQPERIFDSKVIKVRANWDNEMTMDLNPEEERAQ